MPKKTIPKSNLTLSPANSSTVLSADNFTGRQLSLKVVGQLIVDLQHNQRRATADTKNRGEVAGSTKKPWRQKGTGRARVGTRRTPLWRGGGRVFGPTSARNFYHKINKRLLIPGLATVLALKAKAGEVVSLDQPITSTGKTKNALQIFRSVLDPQSNLIIIPQADPEVQRATHNLTYVKILSADQINLLDVVLVRRVIFLPGALGIVTAKLQR